MKLKRLCFMPASISRVVEVVRRMDSLQQIGPEWNRTYPPGEFWARYDRGEFGKPPTARR